MINAVMKKPSDCNHWNGREYVPYPAIIERMAKAIWESYDETRDPHTRPNEPWEVIRSDGRYGVYQAAVAAYRIVDPEFKLPRFDD